MKKETNQRHLIRKNTVLKINACHSVKIGILYVQMPIDEKTCIIS